MKCVDDDDDAADRQSSVASEWESAAGEQFMPSVCNPGRSLSG